MPWKETCAVSERIRLVELVIEDGVPIAEASRLVGVARKCAYKWLERFREGGLSALADRSRARHSQEHATSDRVKDLLIDLRRSTGDGPRKLLWLARRKHPTLELPSASTVSSILKSAGLVTGRRCRRRDSALHGPVGPYRPGERPNEQWTVDFKGQFRLGDRSLCYPLTVQDDATRYVLCVEAHASTSSSPVESSFVRIFRKHGVPERIHSDNGWPFASTGLMRMSTLSVAWMRQDIEVCHSRPGQPQDNPRHERMHRTLKAKTTRPPSSTARGQQIRFGRFVSWMNYGRGHEGLDMRSPGEVYAASPRAYESKPRPFEYPGHWEVRSVRSGGELKLAGGMVFLSECLKGERVGLEEIDDDLWRVCFRRTVLALVTTRGKSPRVHPPGWSRTEDEES